MKNLLLTTALVGFAGAAAADGHTGISFSGSASLGYNDNDASADDNEFGFYSDLDIVAGLSQTLDNGLTVGASFNLDDLGAGSDQGLEYELSLTSETAGLFYGDTAFAAESHWASAGDMESDNFSEADGEVALRGDVTFGGVSASVSYALQDADSTLATQELEQLSVGVSADFGDVNVAMGYQEATAVAFVGNGDFNADEVFGISVGTSFGGADVRLAYADNGTTDSTGIKIGYPIGPVTATAYYVAESAGGDNWGINLAYANGPVAVALDYQDDQGTAKMGLEGSYDIGNGMMMYAGYLTTDNGSNDRFYVAGSYDLGSGASLLVSYAADDSDEDGDEVGAGDYQVGTTVELSFAF